MRRYYLSKFVGDGIAECPYEPFVARFGRTGFLDFRRDQTIRRGWCIACVEGNQLPREVGFAWLADLDFVAICDDPCEELPQQMRDRIRVALDLPFSSVSLKDILVELQLLYSDIRPEVDGMYRIWLLDELWSGSEEEAFAIVANYEFPEWNRICALREGRPIMLSRDALHEVICLLGKLVDFENPGWIEESLNDAKAQRHALLDAVRCVKNGSDSDISASTSICSGSAGR
ncbi:MAG: hypothetical protein KJ000_18360 [Pirellulaceae bacterium]|nr:hypothetical protein [Pirellulaceae bacterium]